MPILGGVRVPQELLKSQSEGKLVVFAGAGVSMPPPSNLPDFRNLADRIAHEAGGRFQQAETETPDKFLGRLQKEDVDVHSIARTIINKLNSAPNPLHNKILSLFASADRVRVITTNFDAHLSTAGFGLFGSDLPVYRAPALPDGHAFNGIVYLHGSADNDTASLVLTDEDFGQAYFVDGWATNFLQAVFCNYTVIFIGYSHNDTVMHYLRRGLRRAEQHYALTIEGQEQHWNFLGISPISYKASHGSNKYEELVTVLNAWVEWSRMKPLDHEARIEKIIGISPPLTDEDDDYISSILNDPTNARFFADHAETVEWLVWAEEKGKFETLLQPNEVAVAADRIIAYWFAEKYACKHPEEAIAFLGRQGKFPNHILWQAIAHSLFAQKPRPEPDFLRRWAPILLQSSPSKPFRSNFLEFLLINCQYPADKVAAILLFEYLTRPHLELQKGYDIPSRPDEKFRVEVNTEGEGRWLRKAWENLFKPNLPDLFETLEPILASHLRQAHYYYLALGKGNENFDPASLWKSAVEPHQQNELYYDKSIDILIDATRDTIECILQHNADFGNEIIRSWADSEIPLLKRLAVHGMTENCAASPDEKIVWILRKRWLFSPGLRHEVFRLLEIAYPEASERTRSELLWQVEEKQKMIQSEKDETDVSDSGIYNLLSWLKRMSPQCPQTTRAFDEIQMAHPDFRPCENPDFLIHMSGAWIGPQSPRTVEDLLAAEPREIISWLLDYQDENFLGPDREGLLNAVAGAAAMDFEWGWKLTLTLRERQEWETDLWGALLRGWQDGRLSQKQWDDVLTFLCSHPEEFLCFADLIADVLGKSVKNKENGVSLSCIHLAESLAETIWDCSSKKSDGEREFEVGGWLTTAINHIGGKIALFWLGALWRIKTEAADSSKGVPLRYIHNFQKVLPESSSTAQMGQVILASQLHFLFALDAGWTRENILPLLNWNVDEDRARKAWDGYLHGGKWSEELLPDLLPLYENCFSRLSAELSSGRNSFCRHLASIAVHGSRNPLDDGWLQKFLARVELEDRVNWASGVCDRLRLLNAQRKTELWERWLDEYWTRRISSIPVRLDAKEMGAMIEWILYLEPIFPKVVEKVCASAPPALKDTFLLYTGLVEKDFAEMHPESLASLLRHLFSNTREPFYECKEVGDLVQRLAKCEGAQKDLLQVCNDVARLGCRNARDLRDLVIGASDSLGN